MATELRFDKMKYFAVVTARSSKPSLPALNVAFRSVASVEDTEL